MLNYFADLFRITELHWNEVQKKAFKKVIPAIAVLILAMIGLNDLAYHEGAVVHEWAIVGIGVIGVIVPYMTYAFLLQFRNFTITELANAVLNRINPFEQEELTTFIQKVSSVMRDFIFFTAVMMMFDFSDTSVILAIFLLVVLSTSGMSNGTRDTIMGAATTLALLYVLTIPLGMRDHVDKMAADTAMVYGFITANNMVASALTVTGVTLFIAGSFSENFRGFIGNGKNLLKLLVPLAVVVIGANYFMSDRIVTDIEAVDQQVERLGLARVAPAAAATASTTTIVARVDLPVCEDYGAAVHQNATPYVLREGCKMQILADPTNLGKSRTGLLRDDSGRCVRVKGALREALNTAEKPAWAWALKDGVEGTHHVFFYPSGGADGVAEFVSACRKAGLTV